ncbi:unnamed protein product [Arabidopsis halleri]
MTTLRYENALEDLWITHHLLLFFVLLNVIEIYVLVNYKYFRFS